jgi:hypothetical protein
MMTTNIRRWIGLVGVMLTVLGLVSVPSVTYADVAKQETTQQGTEMVPVLYVQNAREVTYKDGRLTLIDVSPMVLFFANRPYRIAGHVHISEYMQDWGNVQDNFRDDPPNATLSFINGDDMSSVAVELINPRLQGSDLVYDVKVLEGNMPEKGGAGSLFIDIIGMPLTPVSYAGVARRTTRRVIRRW